MTRRSALAAGVVALAFAAAAAGGCGGDEDDSAAPGTDTIETTVTTTATETTEPGETPSGGGMLSGTVGPGFDISMSTGDAVAPGSYELTVEDLASAHNFHLTGPGVDVMTSVSGEGTETFSIELQPGTYEFVCDPHAFSMNGSFEVSGA